MKDTIHLNTMTDLRRGPWLNLFTAEDHEIVRRALIKLTDTEYSVVRLRFWKKNTVTEISSILSLSQREVEGHLRSAFSKLKMACLSDPSFSRSVQRKETCSPRKAA